jgi:hypothetical protein
VAVVEAAAAAAVVRELVPGVWGVLMMFAGRSVGAVDRSEVENLQFNRFWTEKRAKGRKKPFL